MKRKYILWALMPLLIPLQAFAVNLPPEPALQMTGSHVVVNDDDTDHNDQWDSKQTGGPENKGLLVPEQKFYLSGNAEEQELEEPKLKKFTITAEPVPDHVGQLTFSITGVGANIKLWKDEDKKDPFEPEEDQPITVEGSLPGEVVFYVEGLKPTESFEALEVLAEYELLPGTGTGSLGGSISGEIKFGVVRADIDTNSLNEPEALFVIPANAPEDSKPRIDEIELSNKPNEPGKILLINNGDVDGDGIMDDADGISELGGDAANCSGLKFAKIIIHRDEPFTSDAKVKFDYIASPPQDIATEVDPETQKTTYTITKRGIRLWKKDGSESRSNKNADDDGDFIQPDTEIEWKKLSATPDATTLILYAEYVDISGQEKFSQEAIIYTIKDEEAATEGFIKIGEDGEKEEFTTPTAPDAIKLTLLPVDLAVDANRDGEIKFDGSDKTTEGKPYQFWVNDDRDIGHSVDVNVITGASDWEEDDVDGGNDNDALEHGVKYRRDLEDFTRIKLDLRSLQELLKVEYPMFEGFQLTVTLEAISGQPEINLFKAVEINGGREYLKDSDTGWNQIQGEYGASIVSVKGGNVWNIIDEVLADSAEGDGYAYLLFEGVKKGKGKLRFRLTKAGEIIGEMPVYLELKDVTDMYETWTVGDVADSGVQWENTWPASAATQTTGQTLPAPKTDKEKDYILFIHGWNMSGWEKTAFASTMYKRLWHQGYKGRFGAFRWPTFHGQGTNFLEGDRLYTAHYDGSEQRAWNSAAALASLINSRAAIFKDDNGESLVRCYAHSMGNVVTSEALRQQASAHTYISAQAAIPAHVWDNTTDDMENAAPTTPNVYGFYWQPGAVLTSSIDFWKNQGRPSYMDTQYMPAGTRYINHYNPDDWALAADKWQLNQKMKPDTGYQYELVGLTTTVAFTHNTSPITEEVLSLPDDRYEVFAFAAEARSLAAGAEGDTGGMFNALDSVDLKTQFGFEEEHKGHSAQFRSFIQKRWTYWEKALSDMQIVLPE